MPCHLTSILIQHTNVESTSQKRYYAILQYCINITKCRFNVEYVFQKCLMSPELQCRIDIAIAMLCRHFCNIHIFNIVSTFRNVHTILQSNVSP